MFGKGIYFANCSSKAANYCAASSERNGDGLLIVCEVALGAMHPLTKADGNLPKSLPPTAESTFGKGKNTPKGTEVTKRRKDEKQKH
jgi:poly [ADP-ribose] polymerase